ncbi:LysR family transcriptional regulator [Rhodobacter capsulatus]|uniref:LysR substrate-binding domain-containing protein n=1 Tax=Rhodobacter capsulatus TaxID=1061 RepID=UPI0006DC530B|nr:LysR substrate-binding domain-containing protein [Rhodobacter capsulatus]KQB13893.1 LysR family transcriptional regulator [Rhodobacter capsulatus]KQB13917.1 LysR family transcriptional regulator [Rhodobacter capsulatus]PZX21212.1 DNA-binding transcriptional LysR family regulator [Rhodobacter capsulatus]QNR62538.1 LysR family transcriptional regulator [Rhodobacter capsulatus]
MEAGLKTLEAVQAIARRGSFRAAALDLGLSTTALSQTIARLEANLGVRLFNRTTRSVSLTEAGRDFTARVAPALTEIRAAMERVRAQRETPSGRLRINASAQGGRAVAPLVLEFLRRHPQMQVDLVTEGRLVDIVAEGFDLGIRPADLVPRDMIALPLGAPARHAVVAAPGWLARHPAPLSPADLDPDQCLRVRLPNGALLRWPFEKDGRALPFEARGRLTVDDPAIARAAVLDGAGIGYFIEADVAEDIAAGRMVRLLTDWTPDRPGFSLYYPGRRNASAGFTAFLTLARQRAEA